MHGTGWVYETVASSMSRQADKHSSGGLASELSWEVVRLKACQCRCHVTVDLTVHDVSRTRLEEKLYAAMLYTMLVSMTEFEINLFITTAAAS